LHSISIQQVKDPMARYCYLSIHGRDSTKLVEALKARHSSLAIITDSDNKSLEIIKKNLSELNLTDLLRFLAL